MIDLLKNFSLEQIILFLILLGLAIKGLVSFFDWAVERNKKSAMKMNKPIQLENNIEHNAKEIEDTKKAIEQLANQIDLLVQSDKDSIKTFITQQHHHFCYGEGWIDDYSMDCIEKRYGHYKKEGGNSFIDDLMQDLRDLPRQSG